MSREKRRLALMTSLRKWMKRAEREYPGLVLWIRILLG